MQAVQRREGFTLVELAIVLVIVGLLVGGILVGQDLIKAAMVRATVSDIEKVNAAATTFRTKYGGLPGDMANKHAEEYGLVHDATGRDGTAGRGDGNNLVSGCANGSGDLGCETALFWTDLTFAGLIPQNLSLYEGVTAAVPDLTSSNAVSDYLPRQRLRDSAFLHVYPFQGRNYLYLGGASATAVGVMTLEPAVTPGEARSIDEKFDDAYPLTGTVRSLTDLDTLDDAVTQTANTCIDGTSTLDSKVYNVIDANINNQNCMLQLRTSF